MAGIKLLNVQALSRVKTLRVELGWTNEVLYACIAS